MFLIGLTGGIAAGKSTVAKFWTDLGAIEIDADQLAREAVAVGSEGARLVRERFGDSFFEASGELDRGRLAELVFRDTKSKADLEAIVHPIVQKLARDRLDQLPADAVAIYTVPLLVEANVSLPFNVIVTVEAPEDVRIERLIESRGLSAEQARLRIANQSQPIERVSRADHVLNSNQSKEALLADARNLWDEFQIRAQKNK